MLRAVAPSDVIADVSTTLTTALTSALGVLVPPPIAIVHDLQGTIPTDPPTLTLFLYEVVEDPTAKNRPSIRTTQPPDVAVQKPPMALILRYLLTPWSNDRLTDHRMLACAMQALYDEAILSGPLLRGTLAGTTDSLKISLSPLALEERTRVWHAVEKPYRVSLSYEVRVVNLDSNVVQRVTPVSTRVLQPAVPESNP